MKPDIISNETIYRGKVFDVTRAGIREAGEVYERELVVHGGSAVIVPVDEENRVYLVRQYRHAAGEYLLELPAGTVEDDETPEECAAREIEEEIGRRAGSIERLTEFYVSPGFLTEKMHLFLATELVRTEQRTDDDENITVVRLDLSEALRKVLSNEIADAKTMIGLILAGRLRGVGG